MIPWVELLIAIALIFSVLTGIAAAFGGFINLNFMLAGKASTNPMLSLLAILLILGWKTAGYWELDHCILPLVNIPRPAITANRAATGPEGLPVGEQPHYQPAH